MTIPFMPGPGESIQRMQRTIRTFTDQHGRQFEATVDKANNRPIGEFRPLNCNPPWLPPMRFIWWDYDQGLTFHWAYRQLANELSSHTAQWYSNARKMALKEKLPVPEVGGEVHQLIRDVFGNPGLSPEIPLAADLGEKWVLWGDGFVPRNDALFGNPGLSPEIPLAAELGEKWVLWGDGFVPRNDALFGILHQGLLMQSNEALDIIERRVRERMGLSADDVANGPDLGIVAQTEQLQRGPVASAPAVSTASAAKAYTYNEFAAECRATGMKAPEIGAAWRAHKAAMDESIVVTVASDTPSGVAA